MNSYYNFTTTTYYEEVIQEVGEEHAEALDCLTSINGFTEETINDFLYWLTGYRSLEQLRGC